MHIELRCSVATAKAVLISLLTFEVALVGAYVVLHVVTGGGDRTGLDALLNLDGELNLSTWFSSIQLFAIGTLFAVAAGSEQRPQSIPAYFFYGIGGAFLFLSMDEGASFHERITEVVKEHEISGLLIEGHGAWIIIYGVIGFAFVLSTLPHIWAFWQGARREFMAIATGAAIFVLGAVGFEIVGYLFLGGGDWEHLYEIEVALEEFFELSGASVMLFGALLLATAQDLRSSMALRATNGHDASVRERANGSEPVV